MITASVFISSVSGRVGTENITNNPGAPNNSIQTNNAGAFGGDAWLTWDATHPALSTFQMGPLFSSLGTEAQYMGGSGSPYTIVSTADQAFGAALSVNADVSGTSQQFYALATQLSVELTGSVTNTQAWGIYSALGAGVGTAFNFGELGAVVGFTEWDSSGTVNQLYGVAGQIDAHHANGIVTVAGALYAKRNINGGTGYQLNTGFYSEDMGGVSTVGPNAAFYAVPQGMDGSTHDYLLWLDTPHGNSIYRIKNDGVAALYNPLFSPKYTPNAANYERIIEGQWNSNIAQIGTEAGGSGVLRPLQLIGPSVGIPQVSADPSTSGWGATQEGWTWYNTTTHLMKFWNGSVIKTVATV